SAYSDTSSSGKSPAAALTYPNPRSTDGRGATTLSKTGACNTAAPFLEADSTVTPAVTRAASMPTGRAQNPSTALAESKKILGAPSDHPVLREPPHHRPADENR